MVHAMEGGFWERGGAWVLVQWGLMIAVLTVPPIWAGHWTGVASRWAAVLLFVAGAVFGIGGAVSLGRLRTVFPRPHAESRLVRSGPYAVVRHPLYTSLLFLSWAWALAWHSVPGLVLAAVMAVFLDAKARHEERLLLRKFPDYVDYARRVKRLIPALY